MKSYSCPDCGQQMTDPMPSVCPKCGCPSNLFVVKNEQSMANPIIENVDGARAHKKVYFSDDVCVIGDKVWEFNGYDGSGEPCKVCYSVKNIVSVGLHKTKEWSLREKVLNAIGILLIFAGVLVVLSTSPWNMRHIVPLLIILGALGLILIIVAFIMHHKRRRLCVITTNQSDTYTFENLSNIKEAKKYMAPMRQCLLEN